MKIKLAAATGIAALSAVPAVSADQLDTRWHLDAMASFAYADSSRGNAASGPSINAGEGLGWHLALGRSVSDKWDLSIALDRGELTSDGATNGNTEIDQYGLGVEGTYYFDRKKVAPYLVTGFGIFQSQIATTAGANEETFDGLMYNIGLGVRTQISANGTAIKADARYRIDFYEDTTSDFAEYGELVFNLGLEMPFGDRDETGRSCGEHKTKIDDPRWYVTPSIGYVFADGDRPSENDGSAYSLAIGRQISADYNLEVRLSGMEIDLEPAIGADTEIDKNGLTVELQRYFDRNAAFSPYAGLGIGALRTQVGGVNTTYPVAEAALGFNTQITDNGTSVKAEARFQFDAFDDAGTAGVTENGDWIVSIGLQIPLGEKPAPAAAAPVYQDKAVDTDNDGVADSADACPDTKAGMQVDSVGCVIVADAPATQEPTAVTVYFDLESAELSSAAKAKLDEIVRTMVQRRYIVAVASGYTDTTGEASFNEDLSRKRANAVKAYLIEMGVRTANVIAKGLGEANPDRSNDTLEGRRQNRRVVVRLLDQ